MVNKKLKVTSSGQKRKKSAKVNDDYYLKKIDMAIDEAKRESREKLKMVIKRKGQHKAKCNNQPNKLNEQIADLFVKYLNDYNT